MSFDVGAVEDFPERGVTIVRVVDREIGIVRWDNCVYAVSNRCPHQRGPLCRGTLSGRLTASEPGKLTLDDQTPVLGCPWHGWEFDARTGRSLWDEHYGVRTYAAWVRDGRVLIDVPVRSL